MNPRHLQEPAHRQDAVEAPRASAGPGMLALLALQQSAGNRAVSSMLGRARPPAPHGLSSTAGQPVAQRWLRVSSPHNRFFNPAQAAALAAQFVAILTRISTANEYQLVGNRLAYTARAGVVPSWFDTQMRNWIGDGPEIPMLLVRHSSVQVTNSGPSRIDVDSFDEGFVDVDDLATESDDSARMNLLHLIAERRSVPGYARRAGSSNLAGDRPTFNRAHDQGLVTERDYLRDRLHDMRIGKGHQLHGDPLRFRFPSPHGYAVLHTLPTRGGGQIMTGVVEVIQAGHRHTIDQWLALHPAGFP